MNMCLFALDSFTMSIFRVADTFDYYKRITLKVIIVFLLTRKSGCYEEI